MKEVEEIKDIIPPLPQREKYSQQEIDILTGKICPYCGGASELIDSAEIYNGVSYGKAYICRQCNAYVGCYNFTKKSLGRLANQELREAKHKAHHYFDQLWKRRIMKRPVAYAFLSVMMGTPKDYTHIGMFDIEQCNYVIKISKALLESRGMIPYPYDTNPNNQ